MPNNQDAPEGQPQVGTTDLLGGWSDNRPTEPGFYWYMWYGNVVMCRVFIDESQRLCSQIVTGEREMYLEKRYGQWWLPRITPPLPANDKAEALSLSEVDPPAAG